MACKRRTATRLHHHLAAHQLLLVSISTLKMLQPELRKLPALLVQIIHDPRDSGLGPGGSDSVRDSITHRFALSVSVFCYLRGREWHQLQPMTQPVHRKAF